MARNLKTTWTSDCTVRAYLETQMIEAKPGSKYRHHKSAVAKFDKFLGRAASLKDLSDKTMAAFFNILSGVLPRPALIANQGALLTIARHAATRDIIDWPQPDWESRVCSESAADKPGYVSLLRYYEEVFTIARSAAGKPLSAETQKAYRSAIRAFQRFYPKCSRIGVVNRKLIGRFRQWLIDRGFNEKKAGNHAFAVAAVVKHCMPERFIDTAPPKPESNSRALAFVFEQHYAPAHPATKATTERKYLAVFNSFGRYLGNMATLDDLSDEKVGGYMRSLLQAGKSPRTVNGYRSKLVALWSWCARKRLVEQFPTVLQIPAPQDFPKAWNRPDLVSLLRACDAMEGHLAGIPAPAWWRALHLVAWDSGERVGALLALTWQMLNEKTGKLVVPAEFRKGGRKPMLYVLKPTTLYALRLIQEPARELIFPFPYGRSSFYVRYKRLLKLAGLPYTRYKSAMQKMRRSFATHIEAAGGNATEALSHTERSMTEESYLDPTLIERASANELLFPLEAAT